MKVNYSEGCLFGHFWTTQKQRLGALRLCYIAPTVMVRLAFHLFAPSMGSNLATFVFVFVLVSVFVFVFA